MLVWIMLFTSYPHHLKFAELRNQNALFKFSDQNFVKDRDKQKLFS